jgi:ATP-binding cassette subfamily C (CFTR/MRP) protein 1
MAWNTATQERLSMTTSMLKNIKGIKMTGMTNAVMRQLLRLRAKEIRTSEELRWIMVTANASGKNEELGFCFLC